MGREIGSLDGGNFQEVDKVQLEGHTDRNDSLFRAVLRLEGAELHSE